MSTDISGKDLIKIVLEKIFTNDFINAIFNILMPCILSIRCTVYEDNFTWWVSTLTICGVIAIFNIVSTIIKSFRNKNTRQLTIVYDCYEEHSAINNKFATKIYKLSKAINEFIENNTPISKTSLDKIADFQTFSFSICESIHTMLCKELGKDILCEVTLMKKENNKIKMVAYANNDNKAPSSYNTDFVLAEDNICFVRLFKDLNGEILSLPTKKDVTDNFVKLPGSIKREDEICQYIGIPIKTNRNSIELLLQVDVSKPKVFGKNKKQMDSFAKNILYPYAMLLHKSYERDFIFNQYFDMIVSMLSKS